MSLVDAGASPQAAASAAAAFFQDYSLGGKYWYDEAAAEAAVKFFPDHLTLTTGEFAGQPFVLDAWQADRIIRPMFGWKRQDGTRRFRRVWVWVPRKNGKTELAAGVGLLLLLGDAEPGAEVYSIASDKDQAKICFNKATQMIAGSPSLLADLTPFKTSIWCAALRGSFKPLSGSKKGKHGLNMSGCIGDEVHEWTDDDLLTYVHQSSGARRQPMEFLISTAGEQKGYGWEAWQECLSILSGEIENEETLVVIFAADPEQAKNDPDYWKQESTIRMANPGLDRGVKLSYLLSELEKAKRLPRLENNFKRYHLNLFTEQNVRWLPMDDWHACGHPDENDPRLIEWKARRAAHDPMSGPFLLQRPANERWKTFAEKMIGAEAFGGLDLSSVRDITAVMWNFPPAADRPLWVWMPRFFIPEKRLMDKVKQDRVRYDQWKDTGALLTTPGNAIDHDFIEKQIYEDAERFNVQAIGVDRWNATQITISMRNHNLEAVMFGQGFASMSAPAKYLETLLLNQQLDHGGHPVLTWMASNAGYEEDAAGNIKPSKQRSTERIDGISAGCTSLGVALQQEGGPSLDDFLSNPVRA